MNKQHEALRLAEKMESYSLRSGYAWHCHKAAAELRRLHQSEHEGWRYANELEQERKRLHEANKTMLDALKAIELYIPTTTAKDGGAARYSMNVIAADLVRAAIAKGEQS